MKDRAKTTPSGEDNREEILPEYDFSEGRRNKYAERYAAGTNVVVLDPDVAAVFSNPAEVNEVLRTVAGIIRKHGPTKPRSRRSA
ncbi:MAG TPA: hypothetical protein VFK39_09400 [Gemmatimonadaceae bacterium]|nr:hypothetical protein [Gemmatimonadaceae bacterium]